VVKADIDIVAVTEIVRVIEVLIEIDGDAVFVGDLDGTAVSETADFDIVDESEVDDDRLSVTDGDIEEAGESDMDDDKLSVAVRELGGVTVTELVIVTDGGLVEVGESEVDNDREILAEGDLEMLAVIVIDPVAVIEVAGLCDGGAAFVIRLSVELGVPEGGGTQTPHL